MYTRFAVSVAASGILDEQRKGKSGAPEFTCLCAAKEISACVIQGPSFLSIQTSLNAGIIRARPSLLPHWATSDISRKNLSCFVMSQTHVDYKIYFAPSSEEAFRIGDRRLLLLPDARSTPSEVMIRMNHTNRTKACESGTFTRNICVTNLGNCVAIEQSLIHYSFVKVCPYIYSILSQAYSTPGTIM